MGLLKYVDILIGLTVVMLLLSPLVTAGTQLVTWILRFRPQLLQDGLEKLLLQLNSSAGTKDQDCAKEIAGAVLKHPMIGKNGGRGDVVEREELIRILLEFVAGEGSGTLTEKAKTFLTTLLTANGISNARQSLSDIRKEAQQLEINEPEKAAHVRMTKAIILAAKSDFVGKVNNWFDQAMDRVTQRYALRARFVTVVSALIVATAIQLDSVDLIRRLSTDDNFRKSLVEQSQVVQAQVEKLQSTASQDKHPDLDEIRAERENINGQLRALREPSMSVIPDHFLWEKVPQVSLKTVAADLDDKPRVELLAGGKSYLISARSKAMPDLLEAINSAGTPVSAVLLKDPERLVLRSRRLGLIELRSHPGDPQKNMLESRTEMVYPSPRDLYPAIPGVLLSWVLLSLGAPFWYDRLKDLLKLRPVLAGKEEKQRTDRQQDDAK